MTTFDERERSFEMKFLMDQDSKFKIEARRNKLLGQWAADKLGLRGAAADGYIKELIHTDLTQKGEGAFNKLKKDFQGSGIDVSESELRTVMADLQRTAARQIEERSKERS
jgi:hypothetical protein